MRTVLIRLVAPLQAWGGGLHRWEIAHTRAYPTQSGVIGLVANALGWRADHPLDDLAALAYRVRADRPGHLLSDYQTAGGGQRTLDVLTALDNPGLTPEEFVYGAPRKPKRVDGQLRASWNERDRAPVVMRKHYIADGAFLAGLTGTGEHEPLVEAIAEALARPARLMYLGRRNCPPAAPLLHSVIADTDWTQTVPLLPEASTSTPWLYETSWQPPPQAAARARMPVEGPPPSFAVDETLQHRHAHRRVFVTQRRVTPPPAELQEITT